VATISGLGTPQKTSLIDVKGAKLVELRNLIIDSGYHGISINHNADVIIDSVRIKNSMVVGITIDGASSARFNNVQVTKSGIFGIKIRGNSTIVITGSFSSNDNYIFGISAFNNSSLRFSNAIAEVTGNIVGFQIGMGSNVFIANGETSLNTSKNTEVGLMLFSESSLFIYGGSLKSNHNSNADGLSVFSNSSIDFEDGGTIETIGNGKNGILLENSTLNTFTRSENPAPKLTSSQNKLNGIKVIKKSIFDLDGNATLAVSKNGHSGIRVDNASIVSIVNGILIDNRRSDLFATFGSNVTISGGTVEKIICDKTILMRTINPIKCDFEEPKTK